MAKTQELAEKLYADIRTGVAVIATKPTPNCLDGITDGEIVRIRGNGPEAIPGGYRLISAEHQSYWLRLSNITRPTGCTMTKMHACTT